jgi:hypothetical protein
MRSSHTAAPILLLLAACGSGGDSESALLEPSVRDSAGITIMEYPATAWDAAPEWSVSPAPLAVIGDDPDEVEIDLSNSYMGTVLADGRVLAATMQPAQIYRFTADGKQDGTVGRAGDGPGEYRFVMSLTRLGGDTIAAYDMFKRVVLLYSGDGETLGTVQFPVTGTLVPPMFNGRLADGTWVLQIVNPLAEPPEGSPTIYRLDGPILAWREGMEGFDTLFMLPGQSATWGEVEAGGERFPIGRQVAYGANPFLGVRGSTIWATAGERFVLQAHDSSGTLTREIRMERPPREVTEAERERYKTVLREQFEMAAGMLPPGMLESELAKVDQTVFATHHPEISLMTVDQVGRVWVSPDLPVIDSVQDWRVFSSAGELIGRIRMPQGMLLTASADRAVLRQEDPETGLVRLEVWGLNTGLEDAECEGCTPLQE